MRYTSEVVAQKLAAETEAWGTPRQPFEGDAQYLSRVAASYRDALRQIAAGGMTHLEMQDRAKAALKPEGC